MEYLQIKDILTNKTLQIFKTTDNIYSVIEDNQDAIEVRKGKIGKIIKTWMKDRKNDHSS